MAFTVDVWPPSACEREGGVDAEAVVVEVVLVVVDQPAGQLAGQPVGAWSTGRGSCGRLGRRRAESGEPG